MMTAVVLAAMLSACDEQHSEAPEQPAPEPAGMTVERGAAAADPVLAETVADVVYTQWGAVRGETITDEAVDASARIFRGVPYAEPPVGELRWQPPQPATAWERVRDATEWADRCPQGDSSMGEGSAISEDCLYLNVVTAAESTDAQLPVMVFFHGGGLTTGTGNSTIYNHPMLPSKGVVLVSVNSRLGPIGYLAHPALTAEAENGGSGNYGTLDLAASLQWVQANIAAFGGDPGNVTIFGESGGGTKTISQMATPLASGLFHKAIVQSGSALVSEQRVTMLDEAEATGERLAEALGVADQDDVLAAMRALSWQDIIAAASSEEVGFRANVVVDGYVIPDTVHNVFRAGNQSDVPLIVGANAGESMLQSSVPLMANLHSATASSPTYVYSFSQLPKTWRDEYCVAFHGLELPYVFGSVPTGVDSPTMLFLSAGGGCTSREPITDAVDMTVSDQASSLWAQFARTGDPSVEGLVQWPAYTEENSQYLNIGAPLEARTGIHESYTPAP
ncbi:hypothetical protein LCGC14_0008970 [marine sediment metagenome]|uniref:Carboxylesterase type B domain-containing protein n=2 Tax=root TaxID=1 RepID=A0A0F9W8Z5_9ZZZZ